MISSNWSCLSVLRAAHSFLLSCFEGSRNEINCQRLPLELQPELKCRRPTYFTLLSWEVLTGKEDRTLCSHLSLCLSTCLFFINLRVQSVALKPRFHARASGVLLCCCYRTPVPWSADKLWVRQTERGKQYFRWDEMLKFEFALGTGEVCEALKEDEHMQAHCFIAFYFFHFVFFF